jgi:hypothetical protein
MSSKSQTVNICRGSHFSLLEEPEAEGDIRPKLLPSSNSSSISFLPFALPGPSVWHTNCVIATKDKKTYNTAFFWENKRGLMTNHGDFPTERRRHPRFQVKDRTFVVFDSRQLGELINIGLSGLAFRYLVDGVGNVGCTQSIDLMMGADNFYLDQLPVVVIGDREDETLPYATTVTRIAALRFDNLSPDQRLKLESFLSRHTDPIKA